ncbi:hypothetical protein C7H19_11070 [Aphanothece hegewaldii CCALA 016]|uniref:DUF1540 domain-containing protein n=1 Tax=Aphanothece hegewaldii CCALA 016 TaxID=2107694 RepID=A0A2T1LY69_9CHRO|nr:DUF1540 domain-containing protein [Aphanothece hegewaldii]PSF37327.1 hypothetical protein C7H19_11070 [Aphanothece hegewaldii CCALA 016]
MANGSKRPSAREDYMDLGFVCQCNAINCTYNHEQQCNAGAIKVTFENGLAECYTYTQKKRKVKQVGIEVGEVSQCDVIDCTYNHGQKCMAETIIVITLDDVARCVTYSL